MEPNQPEDAEQPIPMPTALAMKDKANWVHYSKTILRTNKTAHTMGEEAEEDRDK